MEPSVNTKVIEWPASTVWFDEDGVLYSRSKPVMHTPTREESEMQILEFKKLTGNKKVCMILETNHSSPPPKKEDRDWIAKELDSITKAMAIISKSPLSRMIANLFFGFKPPAYPVKFCASEIEAKEWIKKYL
jgi:hypothetical protein